MRGAFLEDLTWPEAGARIAAGAVVVLPVGAAAKEHGPHLPLRTDYLVARDLGRRVAEALPVLVAPVVSFGYYPAFVHYPGSQHLRAETFMALVTDILAGFVGQGARRLAVINTGVSTEAPLRIVVRDFYAAQGGHYTAGKAVRAGADAVVLRLRLPDMDTAGPGAAVRPAGSAGAVGIRRLEVEARDGTHRGT
jgi:creatinine amidohydrolase